MARQGTGMRQTLAPRLGQQLRQHLGLSQTVLTSLSVLRMSANDLAELLAAEARENPFLRPGLPPPGAQSLGSAGPDGFDPELSAAAPEASWQVSLLQQLARADLPQRLAELSALLVSELDEHGMLDTPLTELAEALGAPLAELERALGVLQACEPPGIGARSTAECLRLQLEDLGLTRIEAEAMLRELPRFGRRDWPGLRRALGLTQPELETRADLLRRIHPRPDLPTSAAPVQALRPDLVLLRDSLGRLSTESARDHLPRPSLDPALLKQAKAEGFGRELLERATALIRAVESRSSTLVRIGDWLVLRQEALFTQGPLALRPASRRECAAELGLHPSTVGRAVAGKALLADGRLWPLARLFSAPAPAAETQAEDRSDPQALAPVAGGPAPLVSARAIAHRIAQLIGEEPAGSPLSDEKIVRLLNAEGVDIARRTVAKYRNDLRIPARSRRRGRG